MCGLWSETLAVSHVLGLLFREAALPFGERTVLDMPLVSEQVCEESLLFLKGEMEGEAR